MPSLVGVCEALNLEADQDREASEILITEGSLGLGKTFDGDIGTPGVDGMDDL